jgi:hypothetical protein
MRMGHMPRMRECEASSEKNKTEINQFSSRQDVVAIMPCKAEER